MLKPKYPLVAILWTDACGLSGTWTDIESAKKLTASKCVTVGFLINKRKDGYVTCSSLDESDNAGKTCFRPASGVYKVLPAGPKADREIAKWLK